MEIETRASVDIARPIEQVYDVAVDGNRLPEIMTKRGPIPGVERVVYEDAAPPRAGSRRKVTMSDRSIVGEEIVALDRPTRHAYRWLGPPAFPFSLLVRGAEADWRFRAEGGGTHVEWTYRLQITSVLVYPLARVVVILFRGWMENALQRLKSLLG